MSEIKLLPCPFCGGEAMLDREYIFCDECHLIMRIDDRLYNKEAETYEEARKQTIEAWNTRRPMERIAEQIEFLEHRTIDGVPYIDMNDAIEIVKAGGIE